MKQGYLNITSPKPHLYVGVKNKMSIQEGSRLTPGAQLSADDAGVGREELGQRSQTAPETGSAQNYVHKAESHLPPVSASNRRSILINSVIKSDPKGGGEAAPLPQGLGAYQKWE